MTLIVSSHDVLLILAKYKNKTALGSSGVNTGFLTTGTKNAVLLNFSIELFTKDL